MARKSPGAAKKVSVLVVLVSLLALALLPRCESVGAPTSAQAPVDDSRWFQADPAYPDSADSTSVPPDPVPGLDDPTQPHP